MITAMRGLWDIGHPDGSVGSMEILLSTGKANLDAPVLPPFVVDLQDLHRSRLPSRSQVRAAAALAVDTCDLDDADVSIRPARR
jgi:hypothetical protein